MGLLGYLTGSDPVHKPANIVVLVVILCFVSIVVLVLAVHDPDLPRKEIVYSLISVITLALGYYFGKRG